jgi:hypothetical protein
MIIPDAYRVYTPPNITACPAQTGLKGNQQDQNGT